MEPNGIKWFDMEEPETITGRFFDFQYYKHAGKLSIIQKWIKDGTLRRRTINLDRRALLPDVVDMLQRFMATAPQRRQTPPEQPAQQWGAWREGLENKNADFVQQGAAGKIP